MALGPNPHRSAVIISPGTVGNLFVFVGTNDASSAGIKMPAAGNPIVLDERLLGDSIRETFFLTGNAGTFAFIVEKTDG